MLRGADSDRPLAQRGWDVGARDPERRDAWSRGAAGLAVGASAQDSGPHELGDQRQPFTGVGQHVGVGPRELGAQSAPHDAPERLDGTGRGLGAAHAGELAGAGHERLEHATGLDPPQARLVVDRAHHGVADTRAVARDVAGHDRRR